MRASLSVESGNCTPLQIEFAPGKSITLGRGPTNVVTIHDKGASRKHARIVHSDGRWYLDNVGNPVNGTFLDGQRISGRVPLSDAQEIRIGEAWLRFHLGSGIKPVEPPADSTSATPVNPGELTVLCEFMTASLEATDPMPLIRRALETLVRQTGATLAGFLSLDAEDALPRMIVPEKAVSQPHLSRQLMQQAQHTGKPARLAEGPAEGSAGSVDAFADAACFPLRTEGTAFGALHLYQAENRFSERHIRFAEVVAGALAAALHKLRVRRILEAENARLRNRAAATNELIGSSPALRQLRERITRAAARPATVLIRGESGVGKELVALALHRQSPWCDGPLVVVNCAAIAPTLLEAELFGHRKGAFTGADRDRAGLFEQADGGTLFLDEIGELPPACQAKLLRVIEGKGFRPVGATAEVRAEVRIVAATHRDLEQEVRKKAFRQDLYFRLQVITLTVPPLREHAEDIPELVAHYLGRLAVECRRQVRLTDAALRRLQSYAWPGNVRQLWAVLESAVTMTDGPVVNEDDLALPREAPDDEAPTVNLEELETWAMRQALRRTRGNVSRAAKLLGVSRDTLTTKIKNKGIDRTCAD